jgi:uncharacterized protein (DUF2132 family)
VANTDAETLREFVYDKGLVGASNKELIEELYESLGLGEDDIARREKIKVFHTSPLSLRPFMLTPV